MSIQETEEQLAISNYQGRKLLVQAFAGSGKTSTLVQYSLKHPEERILCVVYNRSVREEAEQRFPYNTKCLTSHQIAYKKIGYQYKNKLAANIRLTDIAKAIDSRNWKLVRLVNDTIHNYVCSNDTSIEYHHCPDKKAASGVLRLAQMLWYRMIDLNDSFKITHDVYLKLFQISDPDLSINFDTILLDESQDSNPTVTDFIVRQANKGMKIIMVGDSYQQIYRFRGADNAFNHKFFNDADRLYITQSFRFGRNVAKIANFVLSLMNEKNQVVGLDTEDKITFSDVPGKYCHTVIHRTVSGVLTTALENLERALYWVGGIESYDLQSLLDLYYFRAGDHDKIKFKYIIKEYEDFDDYELIAKETKDSEMMRYVRLLKKHGDNLPKKIFTLRKKAVKDESYANLTITTAHRSKGLEWNIVKIFEDFPEVSEIEDQKNLKDELNLIYVSATRAKQILSLPKYLYAQLKVVQEKSMGIRACK